MATYVAVRPSSIYSVINPRGDRLAAPPRLALQPLSGIADGVPSRQVCGTIGATYAHASAGGGTSRDSNETRTFKTDVDTKPPTVVSTSPAGGEADSASAACTRSVTSFMSHASPALTVNS